MEDLLKDKDTIRFLNNGSVNLKLLKNQIDRRLLKIGCLVRNLDCQTVPSKINTQRTFCSTSCQIRMSATGRYPQPQDQKVLSSISGNQLGLLQKKTRNPKSTCSNDWSEYLIKCIPDTHQQSRREQNESKNQQKQHYSPIVLSLEDELNLNLSKIQFDDNVSYEEQSNQIKYFIRTTLSNRKKIATDRTNPQINQSKIQKYYPKKVVNEPQERKIKEEIRFIVDENCKEKMSKQLLSSIYKNRNYQPDSKVRLNLLKKIEEKFNNITV